MLFVLLNEVQGYLPGQAGGNGSMAILIAYPPRSHTHLRFAGLSVCPGFRGRNSDSVHNNGSSRFPSQGLPQALRASSLQEGAFWRQPAGLTEGVDIPQLSVKSLLFAFRKSPIARTNRGGSRRRLQKTGVRQKNMKISEKNHLM